MRRSIRLAVGVAALTLGLVFGLPAVAAPSLGVTTCTDFLAPGVYQQVVVPEEAACFADGPIVIRHGLFIEAAATFVLGSEEEPGNNGSITGGVHATNPASVQIHFTTINNGINIQGGSGPEGGPFGITWNAIEDNHISGTVNIEGYDGFWFGFIRNNVSGTVNLNDNVVLDEDGNEYVTNIIRGSLNCEGNSPAPQIGDSGGSPNIVVLGVKTGQCTAV